MLQSVPRFIRFRIYQLKAFVMDHCNEFIYDRFRLEFYPESAVSSSLNPNVRTKVVPDEEMIVDAEQLYLEVGSFPCHTGKRIATNDTATKVNTKIKEKKNGDVYKVSISFQFARPNPSLLSLCAAIDYKPFHVFVRYLGMAGEVVSSRYIYNSLAQSSTSVSEEEGIVTVETEIVNVNGVQMIG